MLTPYIVSEAEAGQKLLSYLQRRLQAPTSALHRWIRSGQVRVNGKRCKPFERLSAGDAVRIPPTAFSEVKTPSLQNFAAPLPQVLFDEQGILLLNKPHGLTVQPGTGHTDSVVTRLRQHYAGADFMPAPAHRLDRDTTGILAVGTTYNALLQLQTLFASHKAHKEYLCWVWGSCPWNTPTLLRDYVSKQGPLGREKMHATVAGHEAILMVRCVTQQVVDAQTYSLLHIRLQTGRTHQIRIQLASRGFPVLGDGKYGQKATAPKQCCPLYLHACRLQINEQWHEALPSWREPWAVSMLPCVFD